MDCEGNRSRFAHCRRRRRPDVSAVRIAVIMTLVTATTSINRQPDLMGSYCGKRAPPYQCCQNRSDSCAVPVLGTLCYCDEFCKTAPIDDCCPDYDEVCAGRPPSPIGTNVSCSFEGNRYASGEGFRRNCNFCKCQQDGSVCCDQELCVTDKHLLRLLRTSSPLLGWRPANYTKFWGRKYKDAVASLAASRLPNRRIQQGVQHASYLANLKPKSLNQDLPRFFDARVKWPGLISGVVDQEWCNTAWAHTTASVAADRLAIQSRGRINVRLSAEELISCSHSRQEGCTVGGHLDRAWYFLRRKGLHSQECYQGMEKYKCPTTTLRSGCKKYRSAPLYMVAGSDREDNIRREISTSGPVQATMRVYRDFFSYRGGVYRRLADDENRVGFTAVRIVGWGETSKDNKYWIVANSWGSEWGEEGYFKIRRGLNECGIEENILAALGSPAVLHDSIRRRHNNATVMRIIAGPSGRRKAVQL